MQQPSDEDSETLFMGIFIQYSLDGVEFTLLQDFEFESHVGVAE